MRPKKMALIASLGAALVLISAVAIMFWFYNIREFSGDGTIEDTGFWSYYRYHIRFPPISLHQPGEYTFSCRGLPPDPLTFKLRTVGAGDSEQLRSLTTVVRAEWLDEEGRRVCEAVGPLQNWVLASCLAYGEYWQKSSSDVTFRRRRAYKLRLIVTDIDADSPPLSVEPMLEGGGNELP